MTLKGKSVCITGAIELMLRSEAQKKIEEAGGKLVNTPSSADFLVKGNGGDNTSKHRTAVTKGMPIIDEETFISFLGKDWYENYVIRLCQRFAPHILSFLLDDIDLHIGALVFFINSLSVLEFAAKTNLQLSEVAEFTRQLEETLKTRWPDIEPMF